MRFKPKNQFDTVKDALKAKEADKSAENQAATPRKRSSILGERQETAAKVQGKLKTVKHIQCAPKRIRLWHGHNRDYESLSESRCQDLIEGFRRAGQQFPAIVRKVEDDKNYDYEVICGARRHWTATHLGIDLLIEERELDDKAAFLLQDIENRDREDISDYERARDYAKALPIYFGGKMTKMAEELQIDKGNFSRFMSLAELPPEIVEAYDDLRELRTQHMLVYNKILKNPTDKSKVLKTAKGLHGEGLSGREIVSTLKRALAPEPKPKTKPEVGQVKLSKDKNKNYRISIDLPDSDKAAAFAELKKEINLIIRRIDRELSETPKSTQTGAKRKPIETEPA